MEIDLPTVRPIPNLNSKLTEIARILLHLAAVPCNLLDLPNHCIQVIIFYSPELRRYPLCRRLHHLLWRNRLFLGKRPFSVISLLPEESSFNTYYSAKIYLPFKRDTYNELGRVLVTVNRITRQGSFLVAARARDTFATNIFPTTFMFDIYTSRRYQGPSSISRYCKEIGKLWETKRDLNTLLTLMSIVTTSPNRIYPVKILFRLSGGPGTGGPGTGDELILDELNNKKLVAYLDLFLGRTANLSW